MISLLKPGKDPPLPSSYPPTGKLSENILFSRILSEISEAVLLLDEQFGFRPRGSMTQHLAALVGNVNRNFDAKRLTVFLDVCG